jgi:hypothetical protein
MFIQRQSIDTNSPIRDCKPCCAPSLMVARAVDARIVAAPEPVLVVLFLGARREVLKVPFTTTN